MSERLSTPIPNRLAARPRDRRGYPIPYIVHIDEDGRPHFQINDVGGLTKVITEKRCGLCGQKLELNTWLIGGPAAAFHEQGAYVDPPVHKECGTYALKVCPFLAMPYSKRIDAATLKEDSDSTIFMENRMPTEQPAFFVFARTSRIEPWDVNLNKPMPKDRTDMIRRIVDGATMLLPPKRPWKEVQFWKDGMQISEEDAERLYAEVDAPLQSRDDLTWWNKR